MYEMSTGQIRIILVDDHKLVRDSWKALLETNPRFQVIGDYDNGITAIEEAKKFIPDIMLVDINMKPMNGFAVTESITLSNPSIKIIGLSVNNQPMYAIKMLELGASGYFTKTSPLDEICWGIIAVINGEIYICEEIKRKMPPTIE
jgi:two-component system, NarL family, invasion response regulator UvrY